MDSIFLKIIHVLCIVHLVSGYNPVGEKLDALLTSTEKVISYYEQHNEEFNFDGIFGLIPLKGALESIVNNFLNNYDREKPSSWRDLGQKFQTQLQTVETIISKSITFLNDTKDPYFIEMGKLLSLDWIFPNENILYKSNLVISNTINTQKSKHITSDKCISQLLKSRRPESINCILPMDCVTKLLNFKSHGYELAHQILYILITFQVNCTDSLANMLSALSVNFEELKNQLCLVLYQDLVNSFSYVRTKPSYQDIVLEQIFVCGSLGYGRFIQLSVLNEILSWQQPSGCFSASTYSSNENTVNTTKIIFSMRQPLAERRHKDGCLSHMTSVATAVLSLYLREFFIPKYTLSADGYLMDLFAITQKVLLTKQFDSLPPLLEDDSSNNINYLKHRSLDRNIRKVPLSDRLLFVKGSWISRNLAGSFNSNNEMTISYTICPLAFRTVFYFICFIVCLYALLRFCVFRGRLFNMLKFTIRT
ncbi:unnamed protein product [Trichobilharzia szidati]|nr:unnamed protein product [Trichobilharzia szidati]